MKQLDAQGGAGKFLQQPDQRGRGLGVAILEEPCQKLVNLRCLGHRVVGDKALAAQEVLR